MKKYFLDGNSLSIQAIQDIVSHVATVKLSPGAKKQIAAARNLVESWIQSGETIYGVTTGFGEFSNVRISHDNIEQLQENLILSHAAGAGEPLPREIVRAMMLLRINALAKG
ncbi:MAG: aromatic amino acid lyase, partial [Ignavibacteriales bacterium]|nr:aromatic amino acid lyase [Ignavibacteriales bacterium]